MIDHYKIATDNQSDIKTSQTNCDKSSKNYVICWKENYCCCVGPNFTRYKKVNFFSYHLVKKQRRQEAGLAS